jgi:hypothetical protein
MTMTTRKFTTFLLLAAFALLGVFLLSACRTTSKPRPVPVVVVAPTNPDIAPVRLPVTKAQSSVQRATVIVEKLIPAPGQGEQIAALKLELSTTAAELTEALAKIPVLQEQTEELVAKWFAENARAASLYEQYKDEQARADVATSKARRASAERDVFVNLFAVSLTVICLMAAAPLIKNLAASTGVYAPVVAMGIWAGAAIGSYLAAYWLIRLLLRVLIVV